jgi:hypothetical protein
VTSPPETRLPRILDLGIDRDRGLLTWLLGTGTFWHTIKTIDINMYIYIIYILQYILYIYINYNIYIIYTKIYINIEREIAFPKNMMSMYSWSLRSLGCLRGHVASWPKSKRSEKPKRFNSGAPWAHSRGIQRKSQGVHPKSGMMLWEFIQHIEIMDINGWSCCKAINFDTIRNLCRLSPTLGVSPKVKSPATAWTVDR